MQVALNTRVEQELKKRLDTYSKVSGRSIASIVAEALEIYLEERKGEIKMVTQGTLEIIEELGKLPLFTIDDLAGFQKELREMGYISYLDPSTDWLIVEKDEE